MPSRIRRTSLTRVRGALNGYQKGRCFYCRAETALAATDVDHFFPWVLKERGEMPDGDGVWNLVLACRACNRGERGKFAAVPSPRLVGRLDVLTLRVSILAAIASPRASCRHQSSNPYCRNGRGRPDRHWPGDVGHIIVSQVQLARCRRVIGRKAGAFAAVEPDP
jgi:hypothetical protein